MKKIIFLLAMVISARAQCQEHDTGDSIEICFDSAKHKWSAVSQYVLLSADTSNRERIQLQAMIVNEGNNFLYKGFAIIYEEEGNPCVDNAHIKITFTDGTTYIGSSWYGKNCESICFFDYYGDDSYVLKKKISSIVFTNGKKSFVHIIKRDKPASYFTRIGNALDKKEFIITDCE